MFNQAKIKKLVIIYVINTVLSIVTFSIGSSKFDGKEKTNPFDIGHTLIPNLSNNIFLEILVAAIFVTPNFLLPELQEEFLKYSLILVLLRHIITFLTISNPYKYKTCDSQYRLEYTIFGHCYENTFNFTYANVVLITLLFIHFEYPNWISFGFLGIYTIILLLLRSGTTSELLFTGLLVYAIKNLGLINNIPQI